MDKPYPQHLFSGFTLLNEVQRITQDVCNNLGRATLASLTSKPLDDIVQALYSEHEPKLPLLQTDKAVHEEFEWFYEPFLLGGNPQRKLEDTRRGAIFAVDIPFTGEGKYFRSRPSPLVSAPLASINDNNTLTIYVPAENYTPAEAQARFDAIIGSIEANLQAQRDTLRNWPMQFREAAIQAANMRISRLRQAESISAGLTFRPKLRKDAPDLTILPVRKQIRPQAFNLQLPAEQQVTLAEEIYQHVLLVMENMSRVMEYSPKAFADLNEETLRFHFLVQLNGQYEGTATGETFNGEGKSDIIIKQGNANVFIAECKIWEGPAAFTAAIDQLQRYVTWRDTKTALVVFNRNKGFGEVIQKAQEAMRAHPLYKFGPTSEGQARFRYVFRNASDLNRNFDLTLMLFDVPQPDGA